MVTKIYLGEIFLGSISDRWDYASPSNFLGWEVVCDGYTDYPNGNILDVYFEKYSQALDAFFSLLPDGVTVYLTVEIEE